jgi:hypothetical protein
MSFRAALIAIGYATELIEESEGSARVTGYARFPMTKRNACVSLVTGADSPAQAARVAASETGAPIVGVAVDGVVQLWRSGADGGVERITGLPEPELAELPNALGDVLDPRTVYRAKTYGAYDGAYQLSFVDAGLLLRTEAVQGEQLSRLLERIVGELRPGDEKLTDEAGHQVLTIAFWLLAARMLKDHGVAAFTQLDGADGHSALRKVGQHYGGVVPILAHSEAWRERVNRAWASAWSSGLNLARIGPEAIGYVYESSLVAKKTRKGLGTHSTPPYLVEYVIGRLRARMRAIAVEDRVVVEPASGHGAFLVAALRVLAEDLPPGADRHNYLRARLRGIEIDEAAREMARVSLTLADVPNPDGWDLRAGDMFADGALEALCDGASVLLSNPPFENFTAQERAELEKAGNARPLLTNKASEMLRRTVPRLVPGALLAVVLPRSFLGSVEDRSVREMLLSSCQVLEVCVFPDGVFQFADQECTVILARKSENGTVEPVLYRYVRDGQMWMFERAARFSFEEVVPAGVMRSSPSATMAIPPLRRLWTSRAWSALGDLAKVQQGLTYYGWVAGTYGATSRAQAFEGSGRGIARYKDSSELPVTGPPAYCFMDLDPSHVRRWVGGAPTGRPQVVCNYHPHSRGMWRMSAFCDPLGAAVPASWNTVRPNGDTPVELLWALCNAHFANAYVYAHAGKRDILAKVLERMPVPRFGDGAVSAIVATVRRLFAAEDAAGGSDALTELDARLFAAYGLFAPAEQQLLQLFEGEERPGFDFDPPGYPLSRVGLNVGLGRLTDEAPLTMVVGSYVQPSDIDQEIDAGHDEMAALLRLAPTIQVTRRAAFVRGAIRELEAHAAARWVPPVPASVLELLRRSDRG